MRAMPLREEITTVAKELGLSSGELREVDKLAYQSILGAIAERFTEIRHHSQRDVLHWAWERLKGPTASLPVDWETRPRVLKQLVEDEVIWLVVEDRHNKMWLYEGKRDAVLRVLEELVMLDEYYIVSKKFEWLLVEDHHEVLHGTGPKVVEALQRLNVSDRS